MQKKFDATKEQHLTFRVILAYMCVTVWVHFGFILGPFWVHFGSILGPFWVHFGSILGPFWSILVIV